MSERILIIDDEAAICRLLELFFQKKGYQVSTAGSGEAAWAAVRETAPDEIPNLAMVDIRLPDINGLDLVARFRRDFPQIEVILMTGHVSVETAVKAVKLGAFAYVTKPLQLEDIQQTVRQALDKQRLISENRRLLSQLQESNIRLEELNRTLERRVEQRTEELLESRAEIQKKARQLETINEITNAIAASLNLQEILPLVVEEIKKLVAFDRASISLAWGSDRVNEVYFLEPRGEDPPEAGRTYPLDGTGIKWVIRHQRPLIRRDLARADRYLEDEFIRETGVESGMVVPLIRRGQVIGTLNLGSMEKDAYDEENASALRQVAGQLAVAIDNAKLYRELEEHSRNLETEVEKRTASLERSLQELREAQERLIQSEKLAATAKLIAGVAHEVKNPLNSMYFSTVNIATILASSKDLQQARDMSRESISILQSDITRLKDMVDVFTSFARPVRREKEEVDLNETVSLAARSLQTDLAGKQVGLSLELGEGIPAVSLEKDEFHRSIINLLLNALAAVDFGGNIRVRTGFADGLATVEVADDGCGIPAEIQPRIFDVFFTTKTKGSGLGLSQVFRMAESHGGHVSLESREGQGAKFQLEIPVEKTT